MTSTHTHPAPKLTGKTALVTGGSSGIGAATARVLASQGARVAVGYLTGADRAKALVADLPGTGHFAIHLPLTDQAAHTSAVQTLQTAYGRLDILIHSAGYTKRIPHHDIETLTPELYNDILTANAGGPYAITRALLPLLQKSDDAVVVGVSSVSAFTGSGSNMAYCAAKAALDTTIRSMARAFGPIRFLAVSPAAVDTGFVPGRGRAELEKNAAQTPLKHVISPEDVADAVFAAVALKASTGTRIVVDGGQTL